jgi:hypothetical protein
MHLTRFEFGDQVFSAFPQETVRFSREGRKEMAQIHRAFGGVLARN